MHIALFSPAWPLDKYQNGIVTYVHWTKLELERLGHRVSVFSAAPDTPAGIPNVYTVRRGRWGSLLRRGAARFFPFERDIFTFGKVVAASVLAVHRRDPIDVIEMEESFGWFDDVARITSVPTLVKLHGPAFLSMIEEELATPYGQSRVAHEGRALARADVIAAPSHKTLAQTLERYKLTPRVSAHIANPLTVASDAPLWQLDTCDRGTILFIGRFDKRKGADVVLRAFASMLPRRPDLRLIVVGPDNGLLQADGRLIRFEAFCADLFPGELRSRVDYRGSMPNREVAQLRAKAFVTVSASRWENASYAALEALLQGCPLVLSDAGGNPEIVTDGVTGRLAQSENPASFAEQLLAMLDDPQAAARMGAAGRQFVQQLHSPAKIARDSLELYARVIAGHTRTTS